MSAFFKSFRQGSGFLWKWRNSPTLLRSQSTATTTTTTSSNGGSSVGFREAFKGGKRAEYEENFMDYHWPYAIFVGAWGAFWVYAWSTDLDMEVFASADRVHPPHYEWEYKESVLTSYDHAALRRGFQVYREVCAACHSLKRISYRHLIGVTHSEAELKEMAAEHEYQDGPNDEGEMFMRPGKVTDYIVGPYANEQQARLANNGAVPPDLTNMVKGREGHEDYVFSLLTGYSEPPAGIKATGALNYNKYMPGTMIAMARNLYDGLVEYEDGNILDVCRMSI